MTTRAMWEAEQALREVEEKKTKLSDTFEEWWKLRISDLEYWYDRLGRTFYEVKDLCREAWFQGKNS